jgi:hypothetical protein
VGDLHFENTWSKFKLELPALCLNPVQEGVRIHRLHHGSDFLQEEQTPLAGQISVILSLVLPQSDMRSKPEILVGFHFVKFIKICNTIGLVVH